MGISENEYFPSLNFVKIATRNLLKNGTHRPTIHSSVFDIEKNLEVEPNEVTVKPNKTLNPCDHIFVPRINRKCFGSSKILFGITETSIDSFLPSYEFSLFHRYFFLVSLFSVTLSLFILYSFTSLNINYKERPHHFLRSLRLKNLNRIIIGHLNINSIRNKILLLNDMCRNNIDILLLSETKIDSSFTNVQFFIPGFSQPLRFDRTKKGGLLLYIRDDIPTRALSRYGNIECISAEITLSKKSCYLWVSTILTNHL